MTEHPGRYLTAYALGNLSEEGRQGVDAHLAECGACADELELLLASAGALGAAFDEVGAPRRLARGRMQQVLASQPAPTGLPKWMLGVSIGALCSILLIVVVGSLTTTRDKFSGSERTVEYSLDTAGAPSAGSTPWQQFEPAGDAKRFDPAPPSTSPVQDPKAQPDRPALGACGAGR